jgi:hypothetical protein
MTEYFITISGRKPGSLKRIPIKGKVYPFTYKGLRLIVHRNNKKYLKYHVTEVSTGFRIEDTYAPTIKESMKLAKEYLNRYSETAIKKRMAVIRRQLRRYKK